MIRKLMTRNPKQITVVLCLVLLLLIPVVDVEYYGKKKKQELDTDKIKQELSTFLCTLEGKYGKRPVIYTTYPAYHDFILGSFDGYDLWIRNVYYSPDIDMKGNWIYWQYTDRAEFQTYNGQEKYMDMNIYTGSMEDFLSYNGLKKIEITNHYCNFKSLKTIRMRNFLLELLWMELIPFWMFLFPCSFSGTYQTVNIEKSIFY